MSRFNYAMQDLKECVSCCAVMNGIYCYSVREYCKDCGGDSKA